MLMMVLDIILLVFLFITLFFGLRLSRQFGEIKKDQARLGELVKQLDTASARAEAAVQTMKKTALETSDSLSAQNGKAQALSEELEIMIEAGDNLAERLQVIATQSRQSVQGGQQPPSGQKKPRTRAEKELQDALAEKRKKT